MKRYACSPPRLALHSTSTFLAKQPALNIHVPFFRVKAKSEDMKRYVDHVAMLEKDHPWVLNERDSFGRGDYDFAQHDIGKMRTEYERTLQRLEELKGKVNLNVSGPSCLPYPVEGLPDVHMYSKRL